MSPSLGRDPTTHPSPVMAPRRAHRSRLAIAWVLVVCVAILVPVSIAASWGRSVMTSRAVFVSTFAPVLRQPAVRASVATTLTNAIQAHSAEANSPQLSHANLRPAVVKALQSPAVNEVFHDALASSYPRAKYLFTGHGPVVKSSQLGINLSPVLAQVQTELRREGLVIVPSPATKRLTLNLTPAPQKEGSRHVLDKLVSLTRLLSALTIALAAIAIWVSPRRRSTVVALGLATAISCCSILLVFWATPWLATRVLPDTSDATVAGQAFAVITRHPRFSVYSVLLASTLTALGGWVAGPSSMARSIRSWPLKLARICMRKPALRARRHSRALAIVELDTIAVVVVVTAFVGFTPLTVLAAAAALAVFVFAEEFGATALNGRRERQPAAASGHRPS